MELEEVIQSYDLYIELNVLHAAVFCTGHEVLGVRYLLETLRFGSGFGANICFYGLE